MKPKSAIEKGKRYEKHIAEIIRESGLDPRAGREIGSGSGLSKGDIRSTIPFLIECKNEDSVPKWILDRIDQARSQAGKGFAWKDRWALVFRDIREPETHSSDFVLLDFNEFLELIKRAAEPQTVEPDRDFKYKLENLRRATNEIIKRLQ